MQVISCLYIPFFIQQGSTNIITIVEALLEIQVFTHGSKQDQPGLVLCNFYGSVNMCIRISNLSALHQQGSCSIPLKLLPNYCIHKKRPKKLLKDLGPLNFQKQQL